MVTRVEKLYEGFVEEFGGELDDVLELFVTLLEECPDAEDQEVVDYVMETVLENNDEVPNIDDVVADFSASWGRKI